MRVEVGIDTRTQPCRNPYGYALPLPKPWGKALHNALPEISGVQKARLSVGLATACPKVCLAPCFSARAHYARQQARRWPFGRQMPAPAAAPERIPSPRLAGSITRRSGWPAGGGQGVATLSLATSLQQAQGGRSGFGGQLIVAGIAAPAIAVDNLHRARPNRIAAQSVAQA